MKKILLLATLVLGMVSCMKDQSLDANLAGDGNFVLSVALPDEATRAAGEDSALGAIDNRLDLANVYDIRYILEVFDATANKTLAKRVENFEDTATETTFELRLIPGRHYSFVVWADFVKRNAQGEVTMQHYDASDLRNIEVIGAQNAMDESRDAYTAVFNTADEGEKFSSASTISMTLRRPFAKLRVVTNDMQEIYSTLQSAKVVYTSQIYKKYDALTTEPSNAVSVEKEYNFDETTAYANEAADDCKTKTLFADYLLGTETGSVQFTLDVKDDTEETIPTIAFNTNIPVERNHLTTIYGPVLTDFNKVTVTIDDNFAQPETVVEQFAGKYNDTLVLSTGTYIFKNLIVETESANAVVVEENANAVVDLVGFARIQSAGKAIYVPASSTLTINGLSATRSTKNGVLEVVGGSGVNSDVNGSAIAVDGKLFINDIASLTAKGYGKCGYGIGGINGEIVIENTTIDYVSGGYVQPLFISDLKYGKSEPEGAAAIGGKKIVISNSVITKAEGGSKAAAIGNRYWESAEVVITNSWLGDIFGGNASAAIGGSRYSSDKATHHEVKVTIENSTIVNAVGGQYGAGIGAGYDTHCQAGGEGSTAVNHIVIRKSNVTAQGGQYAAGIGTGFHAAVLTGSIDEESVVNATAGERFYKGTYTYAQHIGYGVVDPAREYLNEVVVFEVDNEVIEEPSVYAGVNEVRNVEEFQTALNGVKAGDNLIVFAENIEGNVTIVEKPSVKIIINGCDRKYEGSIKIHSNSEHYADAAVTIKNVNFETATASVNFVEALENGSERYSTNITVEECTFTATGEAVNTAVGVQIKTSKNARVIGCTATDMHSLIQAQSCDETVVVEGCTINGKNGVAFKQVKAATVEDTTITALEYGIRFDGNTDNYGIVVKNNNVTAYQPLIVRKMTGKNNTIALEGENTLTTEEAYQIVITNGSDDEAYVKPTGTYTLTGADNFSVYPRPIIAKVGNTEYDDIDEAIAAWTNNTTLTLVANVTLNDVITLKSTEYRILDLGTFTMTAAKGKDAISITAEGRSSASYALDIKADATNPGGITATSKAVVKTTGKSGVKDRPIIRFYNGVYNASNVISHSGSNGTNCPQFQFHNGVYNANITANRALIQIYGGTFNGRFYTSVDSSAYMLISGGKFKYLDNLYGSALNADKFTIGSAKGAFDRGVYVDDEGYIVVGGAVITEFGDKFAAKATNASKAGSYLQYSSAAANGLYYTNAEMAIKKHGEANVVLK